MIYITGDTHIPVDINKLNMKNFPQQKMMTKNNFMIICGDFGGIWDGNDEERYWLKWLCEKSFTTLFVDGNHENHCMLNALPIVEFCGGKAHKTAESIYHLMRGEIYIIDKKKIFTMGGALSVDRQYRKENISWWAEELPSEKEYTNAINNLTVNNWNVDYIISHCCADSTQKLISDYYEHNQLTNFFEHIIKANCSYKKWYFGHYHNNFDLDEKHFCLYDKIVKMED